MNIQTQSTVIANDVDESAFSALRQLDCLTVKEVPDLDELFKAQGIDAGDPVNWFCIILTHSCSLTKSDLDKEPKAELILARECAEVDPAYTGRKNPRKIHIPISVVGVTVNYEIDISDRIFIDKRILINKAPSDNHEMDEGAKQTLINWITDRYDTPAFPDEFNRRLKSGSRNTNNKIVNILRKQAANPIVGLFVVIEPMNEELSEKQPYDLNATLIYKAEVTAQEKDEIERLRLRIEEVLQDAINDGIELNGVVLARSEDEIKLSDYRQLNLLPFDYLSERETPGGAKPI